MQTLQRGAHDVSDTEGGHGPAVKYRGITITATLARTAWAGSPLACDRSTEMGGSVSGD